jgi:hypothetical protein
MVRADGTWVHGTGATQGAAVQQAAVVRSMLRVQGSALSATGRTSSVVQQSGKADLAALALHIISVYPALETASPAPERITAVAEVVPTPVLPVTLAPTISLRSIDGLAQNRRPIGWPLIDQLLAKVSVTPWHFRIVALAGLCLLGSLLANLERPKPAQARSLGGSPNAGLPAQPANLSKAAIPTYSGDPQDTGSGQLLTVIARPGQTLEELSLLYGGHFDGDLFKEICILNPELKDPNHLASGQLVRIPLPPGTLRRVSLLGK